MTLSNGFGRIPHNGFTAVLRRYLEPHAVYRPDDSVSALGDPNEDTYSKAADVDMYIARQNKIATVTDFGDQLDATMQAITLAGVNMQLDDIVTFDGDQYEAVERVGKPLYDPQYYVWGLRRLQNEIDGI